MKRLTLWNCLCSSTSPSSRFSMSLVRIMREFGAEKYFIDHGTANTIQLLVSIKNKFLRSTHFQNKSQSKGIPQEILDKYSPCLLACHKTRH